MSFFNPDDPRRHFLTSAPGSTNYQHCWKDDDSDTDDESIFGNDSIIITKQRRSKDLEKQFCSEDYEEEKQENDDDR
jgi:hypothetical protein